MPLENLRSGIFLAPFHPLDENPTECLQRDLELIEWLERIGFDEAWIGEHHSAGFEIIASPELFIAAAAERTKTIKLGTGVISLPYHNPLTTANRMIQLDHQTRGRVMFGVGPGLLPSDALMLGIDPSTQRDRMLESLDVILRLMDGEAVTEKTEWYNLVDAKLNLLPYSHPRPEIAVASSVTPSGGRAAGKYGLGMLCVAATALGGYNALGVNWQVAQDFAAEHGTTVSPDRLRLVGPMHIAETREQARANVQFGLAKWLGYFSSINPTAPIVDPGLDPVDALIESEIAVIGTPDDAIAQLTRLYDQQGEFGCFLHLAHNWATFENTKKSYELFARHVLPHFKGSNASRTRSFNWAMDNADNFIGKMQKAAEEMIDRHEKEQAAKGTAAAD